MNKNTFVALIVIAIIAIGGLFLPQGKPAVTQVIEKALGAVSTLDGVDNPYLNIAGSRSFQSTVPMTATSSQVCTMKNPFGATSTLTYFSAELSDGILGANSFTLSTTSNSTGYGSSTLPFVLDHSVATNALDSMVWLPSSATTSTTVWPGITSTGESNIKLGPSDWVTYKIATTTGAGVLVDYYDGICTYEFRKL